MQLTGTLNRNDILIGTLHGLQNRRAVFMLIFSHCTAAGWIDAAIGFHSMETAGS